MTADLHPENDIKQSVGWVIAFSIALIVLGILAIIMPTLGMAFFTATIGWIALISGIVMVVQSFRSKPVRGFWLNLIVGIFYGIAGLYILFNLASAAVALAGGAEWGHHPDFRDFGAQQLALQFLLADWPVCRH